MATAGEITVLLDRWRAGDEKAARRVFDLVYAELLILARRRVGEAAEARTLSPSVLVHESFLKLSGARPHLRDRAHFYALAARAMRQIVVDHARKKLALKRGGDAELVPVEKADLPVEESTEKILAVDEALDELREVDERLGEMVELRFFAGLTVEEIADVQDTSTATVKRDWRKARSFLLRCLREEPSRGSEDPRPS